MKRLSVADMVRNVVTGETGRIMRFSPDRLTVFVQSGRRVRPTSRKVLERVEGVES